MVIYGKSELEIQNMRDRLVSFIYTGRFDRPPLKSVLEDGLEELQTLLSEYQYFRSTTGEYRKYVELFKEVSKPGQKNDYKSILHSIGDLELKVDIFISQHVFFYFDYKVIEDYLSNSSMTPEENEALASILKVARGEEDEFRSINGNLVDGKEVIALFQTGFLKSTVDKEAIKLLVSSLKLSLKFIERENSYYRFKQAVMKGEIGMQGDEDV